MNLEIGSFFAQEDSREWQPGQRVKTNLGDLATVQSREVPVDPEDPAKGTKEIAATSPERIKSHESRTGEAFFATFLVVRFDGEDFGRRMLSHHFLPA